ncbi:MAG: biotin transporter BioY [Clostridiales bacterium]|nr:biotin transporter BioY [Clostridiales bacterium]
MKQKSTVYQLTTCALMAALMCILGPMSIPIGPIPISFTNLVLYLTVYLLGAKGATISYLVYMLLGAAGMPVFSGYTGGLAKLAGPTGGYLVGFLFITLISGVVLERTNAHPVWTFLAMVVSTAIAYALGTAWFMVQSQTPLWSALTLCVFPFIPADLAKMVVATGLGKAVRAALEKAQLLPQAG